MYSIEFEGLQETSIALDSLSQEMRDAVTEVLEDYGQRMVDEALASKTWQTDTGRADESISYSVEGMELTFGSDLDYMQYLEEKNPILKEAFEKLSEEMTIVIEEKVSELCNRI